MRPRPAVVAFDIIETVFSLEKLRSRLIAIGLPREALEVWFAHVLRDAFALDATGVYAPFRAVASAALASLAAEHGASAGEAKVAAVLDGFAALSPHPDAAAAFRRLHDTGIRIVALTNGSAEVTAKLLESAGLDRFVERTITIDEVRHWKPRREVYLHAARSVGIEPQYLALVAAHAWDIHGAGRAGLLTAFVARNRPFPATMVPPDIVAANLAEAAEALVQLQ